MISCLRNCAKLTSTPLSLNPISTFRTDWEGWRWASRGWKRGSWPFRLGVGVKLTTPTEKNCHEAANVGWDWIDQDLAETEKKEKRFACTRPISCPCGENDSVNGVYHLRVTETNPEIWLKIILKHFYTHVGAELVFRRHVGCHNLQIYQCQRNEYYPANSASQNDRWNNP